MRYSRDVMSDQQNLSVLENHLAPESVRLHIATNSTRLGTYELAREEIVMHLRSVRGLMAGSDAASPTEVDGFWSWPKGEASPKVEESPKAVVSLKEVTFLKVMVKAKVARMRNARWPRASSAKVLKARTNPRNAKARMTRATSV